ncbi:MAG: hypothetical protein PHI90_05940 [Clostridia bacterium]|nr:hypothetical protein [Clostridia bacterium]MDD4048353.1 hypothetical protein [Clostridia bacterium]
MNYKVVYFSRTGTSKRVAEKIANKLSCEAVKITDNMNWDGVLGFIKGGYYAVRKKDVKIEINGNIDDADEIILVTPLWANRPAPAIEAFYQKMPLDKIHLVVTSNASKIKEHLAFKSLSEIIKNKNNEDLIIETLVNKLL